jgi:hypothetical protein
MTLLNQQVNMLNGGSYDSQARRMNEARIN